MKQLVTVFAVIVLVAQLAAGSTRANENAANGCLVPHRSAAAILESAGTHESAGTLPEPVPYQQPDGMQADSATVEAVTETVAMVVECVNAGDIVGFLSLLSDDFLRHYLSGMGFTAGDLESQPLTPIPENERLSLREVRDVTELPDGRIAARVVFDQGELQSPELDSVLTFVSIDDYWRIDEWQPVFSEASGSRWEVIRTGEVVGTIVPLEHVSDYVDMVMGLTVQGMWTPTEADIQRLEALLPEFLSHDPKSTPDLVAGTAGHFRHYIGFVYKSRTFILVNAFCTGVDETTTEPMIVMDGGDCFFSVTYDLANGKFSDLMINGES